VLYDLEHEIYTRGHGGLLELGINLVTAVLSVAVIPIAWRFRHTLLGLRGSSLAPG